MKNFLSRKSDIYRAAFTKRTFPHLRQCIFIGTTNADNGYLRDTTGNRRFWPVKTPGGGSRHSWELTKEEVAQIWAETILYVKAGERLYLLPEEEKLAGDQQRDAMESDEREGVIREYLDTLLPEGWENMDAFDRRRFLTGDDVVRNPGTQKRTSVCTMEIWCECFGKDRGSITRTDSNQISSILIHMGWERQPEKLRVRPYGPQYCFTPENCS